MKKEDFRVVRTKTSIVNAFMNLMKEKAYGKITIKEITEKAIVNRNTFYLHYLDKDDLLEKIVDDGLKKMINNMQSKQAEEIGELTYEIFTELVNNQFTVVEEDLDFFQLIFEDESIPYLQSKFVNAIRHHMSGGYNFNDLSIKRQAYIEYLASGIAGLIKFWIRNFNDYTSTEMTVIVIDIYSKDVLDVLKALD